jgi:CheY-like chemotaxis protein
MWNLVKNAVKFTPSGGTVTITSRDVADGRVAVSVADTGRGIEPSALGRIFNAFEQGEEATTQQYGGLGLGLTISRAIVEDHGGSLTAISAGPGQGATFTVELATVAEGLDRSAAGPDDGRAASQAPALRILVVEDDRMTARVMTRLLRDQGHRVTVATTLAEALAAAETDYDLIISDLGLPDGSGLELIQRLGPRRPPVGIALSGFGMEDDVRRSREAGFAIHLTKPIDFPKLQAAIREASAQAAAISSVS